MTANEIKMFNNSMVKKYLLPQTINVNKFSDQNVVTLLHYMKRTHQFCGSGLKKSLYCTMRRSLYHGTTVVHTVSTSQHVVYKIIQKFTHGCNKSNKLKIVSSQLQIKKRTTPCHVRKFFKFKKFRNWKRVLSRAKLANE